MAGVVSAAAIVVVLLIASAGGSDDASEATGIAATDGASASALPDLTLWDFGDNEVQLASYVGKPLVINFWASWCVPCLAEMPGFEQVYQRRLTEVEFLGINLQDEPGAAQAVIRQTGITYPVVRDVDGSAFVALQAISMPTTIFVSAEGNVLALQSGAISAGDLEDRIVSLFGF